MKNIYSLPHLRRSNYGVALEEQEETLRGLAARTDVDARGLKRYLALPDLTRVKNNPVKAITDRVLDLPSLRNLDLIETPVVISPALVFDLFNFPKHHPARTETDTYYLDEDHILRPYTSLMWKYYLEIDDVAERLEQWGSVGALSFGPVYRRDAISWQHSNVLHQIDGLYICKREIAALGQPDLEAVLLEMSHALFGPDVKTKFRVDHFPYTDPGLEMNIAWDDKWVEVLGAGIVNSQVLENLGFDPDNYNGWAFGAGADRLAMIKMRIPDIRLLRSADERVTRQWTDIDQIYRPVVQQRTVTMEISFVVENGSFSQYRYYELAREVIGVDLIEEMKLLNEGTVDEKLGPGKVSYSFRIVYGRVDDAIRNEDVDVLHKKLEGKTVTEFGAVMC